MEKQIAYIRNKMIGLIALIAIGTAWQWDFIVEGVMSHVYTTGSILSAFGFSVVMAFIFISKLRNEVIAFNALKEMWDDIRMGPVEQASDPLWRHYRCSRPGRLFKRPRLLGHAYDLVTEELARTKKIRISVETMNTLVHKISQTIDDEKSLLGYMSGLLVFMGLIGTFIGLLHMVGSMGGIIGTLASSAGGSQATDAFQQLLGALQEPLKGMASGFAASLFGLFSSLIVGLLGRLAGQAAGVLKHGFESWLAGVVQIGDEEEEEAQPLVVAVSESPLSASLIQTTKEMLHDYAKVAGSFDQTIRLLQSIQVQQQEHGQRLEGMVDSLMRIGDGLEALTGGVSSTIAAELAATRAMVHDMERSHTGNLRSLASNHAQTAVTIAAAIEQNAAIAERLPSQLDAAIEGRIRNAVGQAFAATGLTVADQMRELDNAFPHSANGSARPPATDGELENPPSSDDLEDRLSDKFDLINRNVGAAFTAYSDVLTQAVAALDKGAREGGELSLRPDPGKHDGTRTAAY
jgi:hypothetical protein